MAVFNLLDRNREEKVVAGIGNLIFLFQNYIYPPYSGFRKDIVL